jgi:hypothetical protein
MLEAMTEWMSFPLYYAYDGAAPPPRAGAAHATIYPYGPFTAGDGKTVMLGLQNEREWVIFCAQVLQQPALATDARFSPTPSARPPDASSSCWSSRPSPASTRRRWWPAGRGRHRQRPGQWHGRPGRTAAEGARTLDRGGTPAGPVPGAAAARPAG